MATVTLQKVCAVATAATKVGYKLRSIQVGIKDANLTATKVGFRRLALSVRVLAGNCS